MDKFDMMLQSLRQTYIQIEQAKQLRQQLTELNEKLDATWNEINKL